MQQEPTETRKVEPLLSVITTCRNAGETLGRCVYSTLGLRLPGVEHIVVDAMSTDNTLDVLSELQSHYGEQLVVLREADNSMTESLLKAVRLARGRYLAPLNVDDFYLPEGFSFLVEKLADQDPQAVFANSLLVRDDGRVKYRTRPWACYWPWAWQVFGCMTPETGAFFRRDLYDAAGGYDDSFRFCQDWDFYLRLVRCCRAEYWDIDVGAFLLSDEQFSTSYAVEMRAESARISWFGTAYRLIQRLRLEKVLRYLAGIQHYRAPRDKIKAALISTLERP